MYLTHTGLVCSVGLNAQSACAAMRAGISGFEELPYVDNQGEPIVGAFVPTLAFDLKREQRLIELLSLALEDCLSQVSIHSLEKVPLLVGLAEPERPGGGAKLATRIINEIERKLLKQFHPQLSRAFPKGHVAGFETLQVARELLQQDSNIPACLVCSVDSYINASSLLWLDQHDRLKTEDNSDGVIPGEAAAAVIVQRQLTTKASIKITGLGFGYEKVNILSEEPLLGLGLTEAARKALVEAGIQIHETDFRLSDVTGESYGFKEQALMVARLLRVHQEEGYPIWHCAEYVGDLGASAGISQLVMAFHAFSKGYAPGKRAISYTSAVTGERAVVILEYQY